MNKTIAAVTKRVTERSKNSRDAYLQRMANQASEQPHRGGLSCSNLAHGMAACGSGDKAKLAGDVVANLAIVSAYNEMLSAHQPFVDYPEKIKAAAEAAGAIAQFAGGVPAMCDGVTQGQDGMDLSLFSRDVIALSTAVALSHNMFDGTLCLGICDKIVPGLLIGALAFGHLPTVFVPAGPMPSGLPNKEKARVREQFAAGEIGREELLAAESASYHSPGTCTFYGTANTNQMMMEFMGLQLPGGSFVNPGTEMRDALTAAAVHQALANTRLQGTYRPLSNVVDEKAIINGIVGLLATGGSTNHTLHIVAIAAAAGIQVNWSDFSELSSAVPLLARVYPNGLADVNHFHAAGGLGFVMRELLAGGLMHADVTTIRGEGLSEFVAEPVLADDQLQWRDVASASGNLEVLAPLDQAFSPDGGIRLVEGNVGRAVVKVSAVAEEHRSLKAQAVVFDSQQAFVDAFNAGDLNRDLVAVVPFQGPKANGMPELHKLTPYLGVLQNQGYRVALLTDGRMSGASGKILAAIQATPEALDGSLLAKIQDGDWITIDAESGEVEVDNFDDIDSRTARQPDLRANHEGLGRELFGVFRANAGPAEAGAHIFGDSG